MSSSRARAVPELFLTFLAPSLRPSLPRLPSSRRPLSSAIQAHKNATVSDQHARPSNRKVERKAEQQARSMSRIAATRTLEHSPAEPYVPVASTSGKSFLLRWKVQSTNADTCMISRSTRFAVRPSVPSALEPMAPRDASAHRERRS